MISYKLMMIFLTNAIIPLSFGRMRRIDARGCDPMFQANTKIKNEMLRVDKDRVRRNKGPPICLEAPKYIKPKENCSFFTLDEAEWGPAAEDLYMHVFVRIGTMCDINDLLFCDDETSKCQCKDESSIREGRTCRAKVGNPCEFNVPDTKNLQLKNDEVVSLDFKLTSVRCVENARCVPVEDFKHLQNITGPIRRTIKDATAGYTPNLSRWPDPIARFILRRISSICLCKLGYKDTGTGKCLIPKENCVHTLKNNMIIKVGLNLLIVNFNYFLKS